MCVPYTLNDVMSIRKWRQIKYTDDGCTLYECLHCYNQFEGRLSPKEWKFCPYCGVEWEGEHEWLFYDDNYKVIEPARMREDRRVCQYEARWIVELQQMPLFKCDDGAYVPLQDGSVKNRWSSMYPNQLEHMLVDTGHEEEKAYKKLRNMQAKYTKIYGYHYGSYVYYRKFMQMYLEQISKSQIGLLFTEGEDYRMKITQERYYHDVVNEKFEDLGGWRQVGKDKYEIRQAGETFDCDDLEGHWKDHGHKE
jgi:hypothetical protein